MKYYIQEFLFVSYLVFLVFLSTLSHAQDITVEITVAWDADIYVENETAKWEKLYFYISDTPDNFNYDNPIKIIDQDYIDNISTPIETTINYPAEINVNKQYFLVVRAYATIKNEPVFSIASNTVDWYANMLQPLAPTLTYIVSNTNYTFSWDNTDPERINDWVLQRSIISPEAGPNSEFANIRIIPKENGPQAIVPISELWPENYTNKNVYVRVFGRTIYNVNGVLSNVLTLEEPVVITIQSPQGVIVNFIE